MLTRRRFLTSLAGAAAAAAGPSWTRADPAPASPGPLLSRPIPSSGSGDALPLVGLGSWITFNVGDDPVAKDACAEVMRAFFTGGGRLIDSSPMYGSSQEVIGYGWNRLGRPAQLFAADKVWISSGARGPQQVEESRRLWGVQRFDLLQVHNVTSWQ